MRKPNFTKFGRDIGISSSLNAIVLDRLRAGNILLPRCMHCHKKAVCLSVRLSVTRVICDKTEESSAQIDIPYERSFILVF